MPYLKFLDENKRDIGIPPIDMAGIEFRIAPARVPGVLYTFVNASTVITQSTDRAGTAVYIATFEDVDSAEPLVLIRMVDTRHLLPGNNMMIVPGGLVLDMTRIRQGCDDYTLSS